MWGKINTAFFISRRIKWHQNDWIWTMFCVIETKTLISCFRFNNPKHCSNSIILVSFYSSRREIKICIYFFSNVQEWQLLKVVAVVATKKIQYFFSGKARIKKRILGKDSPYPIWFIKNQKLWSKNVPPIFYVTPKYWTCS